MLMMKGVSISPGVARGTAWVITLDPPQASRMRHPEDAEVTGEIARFHAARSEARAALHALEESVRARIGTEEAAIFGAQALMIDDPAFVHQVTQSVSVERINAEAAVGEVIDRYARTMGEIRDPYFRERASDVVDVGRRVMAVLTEHQAETLSISEDTILVTNDLLPSAIARLESRRIRGLITEHGSRMSHSAILARALATPTVSGVEGATRKIATGDPIIVDGSAGLVFVAPEPSVVREYDRVEADLTAHMEALKELIDLPARTIDGLEIKLYANIGKTADVEAALLFNADGIGLYRTEFAFLIRPGFPSEEEQFQIAFNVAARLAPRPVTFRLLDLGTEKTPAYFPLPPARNPALALRGLRLLLEYSNVLSTQLRALLRVNAVHPVRLLLPMVGGLDEVGDFMSFLATTKRQLAAENVPSGPSVPIGAMIEIPSAAVLARSLADSLDFLSLGTNDLVQYMLAADRDDETMARYYQPLHPGVLAVIKAVADAARAAGKELTICGDMAGDPAFVELLLGLGLRSFSVAPGELLEVKNVVRHANAKRAAQLAMTTLSSAPGPEPV